MSSSISDVPKLRLNWDRIKNGFANWHTANDETETMQPILKRTVAETITKELEIPKPSSVGLKKSLERSPLSRYTILNEKIRLILQDTNNFNERIESFSGTSKEDKEYLDIEEVLFYNLNELIQIQSANVKLKRLKLDAILNVQEKIKELDLKLEENKTNTTRSGSLVPEGKNKTKCLQKSENLNNEAKCTRKRLHFQVTKHSVPLPLIEEINIIKTSLKSCGESRQNRKHQIFKNLANITAPEERQAVGEFKQEEVGNFFNEEIAKIRNNLQSFQKNKPYRQKQIIQSLSLLEILENPQELKIITSERKLLEETSSRIYENYLEEQEPSTNLETTKINLVQVLSTAFTFKSNNSVTNTLKLIQSCLQGAQTNFEYFKNNHKELIYPQFNDQTLPLEPSPVILEEPNKSITENEEVAEVVDAVANKQVAALLMQIRLLLFVAVLKIIETPVEMFVVLIALMWLWERR